MCMLTVLLSISSLLLNCSFSISLAFDRLEKVVHSRNRAQWVAKSQKSFKLNKILFRRSGSFEDPVTCCQIFHAASPAHCLFELPAQAKKHRYGNGWTDKKTDDFRLLQSDKLPSNFMLKKTWLNLNNLVMQPRDFLSLLELMRKGLQWASSYNY